jgi:hypothetical protein
MLVIFLINSAVFRQGHFVSYIILRKIKGKVIPGLAFYKFKTN